MCEEVKTYIFQCCGFELNNTDPEADFRDLGSGSYLIQIYVTNKKYKFKFDINRLPLLYMSTEFTGISVPEPELL